MAFDYAPLPYRTPPELSGGAPSTAAVAIVGAGPIGLAAAIDLALHGVKSAVLDDDDAVSVGSRAICWAKRTLEIFDRLGVGERMLAKGVTWKVGRLFHGETEIYSFDLAPEPGYKMPAFINLQQYYVEQYLIERCADFPDLIDLRWRNRVVGVSAAQDGAAVEVETPDGVYQLEPAFVLACDGANSAVRRMMGLELAGERFEDRFLIADVVMTAEFPSERWFWFEPPFHSGQTALLHKQPDNLYRIDLQLGPDADPEEEKRPEVVTPRLEKALGGRPFELDWVSVYRFRCARLERFVHGPVIFVGDSAHVVSPFGARGGNGGIHDVDNLCWKLAAVVKGAAPAALLDSYDEERGRGADENIKNASRATRFMSPPTEAARMFRDQTLRLAEDHPFARRLINSGRLSTPCALDGLSLQAAASESGLIAPGAPCPDAPCPDAPRPGAPPRDGGWLLERLGGRFALLEVGAAAPPEITLPRVSAPGDGHAAERYGVGVHLIRPDQHVAASWTAPSAADIADALARAGGRTARAT